LARPALEGLRILDLTQVAAGPYAAFLLGFMGAQVIKVESCSRMDISRGRANPTTAGEFRSYPGGEPGERPWNRSAHHVHRNINKLSVTLDLSKERGKELFLGLAKICDLLMENYRAPVMDRLGLGYEAVSKANPQLIYLKISSQGDTGPERDYGSLGSTLEQTAGIASVTGYEDGVPMMTNETFPDPLVGILAVGAVLAGLRRRRKTGFGGFIDLSQREATVGVLGEDGYTQISPRGSIVVYDDETLGFWDRGRGRTHDSVTDGTKVTVYFRDHAMRDLLPAGAIARFYGTATTHLDDDVREKIWEMMIQPERDRDPDKKGSAVLVKLERAETLQRQPLEF